MPGEQSSLVGKHWGVVKEMAEIETVATDSSSSLYKAMVKLYNLLKKPKNVRQGLDNFLKQEDDILKNYMLVKNGK